VTASWDELLDRLAPEERASVHVVGNLPYHVATPILLRWLERSHADTRLPLAVFMVQAEVAARLASSPGMEDHGSLGALASATHEVREILHLRPGSFRPVPQVDSTVVTLRRREAPLIAPGEWAEAARFVHAAFMHRRKQLAVALAGWSGVSREDWRTRLAALGAPPQSRAEDLDVRLLLTLRRPVG
jgi:16S rRNA (adenine1518-N6/adenine1519-N6)-dimethyltransferase